MAVTLSKPQAKRLRALAMAASGGAAVRDVDTALDAFEALLGTAAAAAAGNGTAGNGKTNGSAAARGVSKGSGGHGKAAAGSMGPHDGDAVAGSRQGGGNAAAACSDAAAAGSSGDGAGSRDSDDGAAAPAARRRAAAAHAGWGVSTPPHADFVQRGEESEYLQRFTARTVVDERQAPLGFAAVRPTACRACLRTLLSHCRFRGSVPR